MFLNKLFFILICASSLCLVACNNLQQMHTQTVPDADYHNALKSSNPQENGLLVPNIEDENAMIERVIALYSDYNKDNLLQNVTQVYAPDVYFRDAFKQYSRAEEIRDYMIKGLRPLHQAEFIFNRVAHSGGDYYFDWTMRLDFKKTPPETWEESIGVSHMRFNSEGKVVFHQDYWDPTDIIYRRIPLVRQLIAYVKTRF